MGIRPTIAFAPKLPQTEKMAIISETAVRAQISSIVSQGIVYLTRFEPENTLINCLIQKESSGRVNAVGKAGEIGILQFKWETFYSFSKRYKLDLSIYNPDDQILLTEKMLADGYSYHWTTYRLCLKK